MFVCFDKYIFEWLLMVAVLFEVGLNCYCLFVYFIFFIVYRDIVGVVCRVAYKWFIWEWRLLDVFFIRNRKSVRCIVLNLFAFYQIGLEYCSWEYILFFYVYIYVQVYCFSELSIKNLVTIDFSNKSCAFDLLNPFYFLMNLRRILFFFF